MTRLPGNFNLETAGTPPAPGTWIINSEDDENPGKFRFKTPDDDCCCDCWYEVHACQICVDKSLQPSMAATPFPNGLYVQCSWVDENPIITTGIASTLVWRDWIWCGDTWQWQCYCFEVVPGSDVTGTLPDGSSYVSDSRFYENPSAQLCGLWPTGEGGPGDPDALPCDPRPIHLGTWPFCVDGCGGCCLSNCCGIGRVDACCCFHEGQTGDWSQVMSGGINNGWCTDGTACPNWCDPWSNNGTVACISCSDSLAEFEFFGSCAPFSTLCFGITESPYGCLGTTGHWLDPDTEGCGGGVGPCLPADPDACTGECHSDPDPPVCCYYPTTAECPGIAIHHEADVGCHTLIKECKCCWNPGEGVHICDSPANHCTDQTCVTFSLFITPSLNCIYCADTIYGYRECLAQPDYDDVCDDPPT